ncbi:glucose-6-phosphate isomerase [Buchnera aphidicola]|uniref:Glucose-6-phosphate isomerase n=1 Tax=Buchnera aphidicola (Cinara strobi) TaxID=1921549 RepID=A0A3B1E1F1_9GAMM|nr:glucose-6-phosphate isomerase [Buchnera aphidicola]VAX76885.1 Glucose-6-phosphate isomerase [Buchnera aphidicola (Cinara strobi)]
MKNINPIKTLSWKKLLDHFLKIRSVHMKHLFNLDKNRFIKYSIFFKDCIVVDFSKNRISDETLHLLLCLAKECFLEDAIKSMFLGRMINKTENRSVLHIALRNNLNNKIIVNDFNIMNLVQEELKKIKKFSNSIINGSWLGYTGKKITDVVNIGIGGSYLGPYMVTEALKIYKNHLKIHYLSNIDGTSVQNILRTVNLETSIFLVASKSFSTDETLSNANYIKNWCILKTNCSSYLSKHFFALCENVSAALDFGISGHNIFKFWEWVGGRYSLWSASGLSIALSIGFKNFKRLLNGAYDMDQHFLHSKLSNNIPVILGLISIWYTNFFCSETEAIFPYDQYMHIFPEYLQQCFMESNGKSIDRNGSIVSWKTGSIVWGQVGTNGQHSFFQLLHQGTTLIPCDFIIPAISHNPVSNHHKKLFSNFLAQTQSLAFGNNVYFKENNFSTNFTKNNNNYQYCSGNKPTNSIFLKKITPYSLGSLIALYEHKVFVQGVILNIYSFDQWGVELGKSLANNIYDYIFKKNINIKNDSSTEGLINLFNKWNKI